MHLFFLFSALYIYIVMKKDVYYIDPKEAILKTLQIMQEIEAENVKLKSLRFFAFQLLPEYREKKNIDCIYRGLWDFMRNNFQYKEDEPDELIISPFQMLQVKAGDCDDFALFAKTILHILGVPSNYILFGRNQNDLTHIAVITKNGFIIDPTNSSFNRFPEGYTNIKIFEA